jgi:hypothetical protein
MMMVGMDITSFEIVDGFLRVGRRGSALENANYTDARNGHSPLALARQGKCNVR